MLAIVHMERRGPDWAGVRFSQEPMTLSRKKKY